ncbi:MAG: hypothetical protein AAF208_10915 [Cyanobacteria bacterium P01_A01_bin.45]
MNGFREYSVAKYSSAPGVILLREKLVGLVILFSRNPLKVNLISAYEKNSEFMSLLLTGTFYNP